MGLSIQLIDDKAEWESFVLHNTPTIFLQSWNWGDFSRSVGEKVFHLGVYDGSRLVGTALVTKVGARRGAFLACPGGPLIDWTRPEILNALTQFFTALARQEEAWYIRVRPTLRESDGHYDMFRVLGFRDAPMHMHAETTLELSLGPSSDQLLAHMDKKDRYTIRKAIERDDLEVHQSSNLADVAILYKLQQDTVTRHGFVPFALDYLEKQFSSFLADDQVKLFLAIYNGQIISAAMIMFYGGTAAYHYGASATGFDKVPASYLIQWEAINEAKRRGCHTYNFWGIAKDERPDHPWAGLTQFKRKFRGERVDYVHAQDLIVSPLYWITYAIETARRKRRRL